MEPRATRDLAQRADPDFFAEVSVGLKLVMKNVARLHEGVVALAELKHGHASRVLSKIAEEEAAKFLILLDAVRCPRQPSERFAVQLRRFGDHLAKGLYAKACSYRPGTLGQLQEYLDLDRNDFYLDGPNGVDWIFRNEVIHERESAFYVDYVRLDDGHQWIDPLHFEDMLPAITEPESVRLARYLHDVGMAEPEALLSIAELWRTPQINADTPWTTVVDLNWKTLKLLESRGQLLEQPDGVYRWIHDRWPFPMFGLDLTIIKTDRDALREQQKNWSPENW